MMTGNECFIPFNMQKRLNNASHANVSKVLNKQPPLLKTSAGSTVHQRLLNVFDYLLQLTFILFVFCLCVWLGKESLNFKCSISGSYHMLVFGTDLKPE